MCQELLGGQLQFFPGKAGVTVTDGSLLVLKYLGRLFHFICCI